MQFPHNSVSSSCTYPYYGAAYKYFPDYIDFFDPLPHHNHYRLSPLI